MQSPSAAPCEQERQDMVVVTPAPATPNSVSTPQIFSPTGMLKKVLNLISINKSVIWL